MEEFKKTLNEELANLYKELIQKDVRQLKMPKDVITQIEVIEKIRIEINPEEITKYNADLLIKKQLVLNSAKYIIGKYVAELKGGQSYAYIYRKFKTASDWNKTKDELGYGKSKGATVNEIQSEIEKYLIDVRKTEIAYQVASDKLEVILSWATQMIMIIQNRLREENTDKKMNYVNSQAS